MQASRPLAISLLVAQPVERRCAKRSAICCSSGATAASSVARSSAQPPASGGSASQRASGAAAGPAEDSAGLTADDDAPRGACAGDADEEPRPRAGAELAAGRRLRSLGSSSSSEAGSSRAHAAKSPTPRSAHRTEPSTIRAHCSPPSWRDASVSRGSAGRATLRLMRLWLAVAAALWAGLLSAAADARMMRHFDLRSLFIVSDAVVAVRRVAVAQISTHERVTTFEVVKSYAGPLERGARFDVPGPTSYAFTDDGTPSASQDVPEALTLFLVRVKTPQPGAPAWTIVPSGIRMVVDGKARRFEQSSNPGPYVPVLQGRDPLDVLGLPGGEEPLDADELDGELARARERAVIAKRALEQDDPTKATPLLLEVIGPGADEPQPAAPTTTFSFYEDRTAMLAIERLVAHGDIDAVLEGYARANGGLTLSSNGMTAEDLAAAASQPARSLRLRLAALATLRARSHRHTEESAQTTAALLRDETPAIRAAAAAALGHGRPVGLVKSALRDAWDSEQDESVLEELLAAANQIDFPLAPTGKPPVLARALRDRDVVDIAIAFFDARDTWAITSARVEITPAGAGEGEAPRPLELFGEHAAAWGSTKRAGARLRISPDPPLAPGRYDLRLVLQLTGPGGATESRRLLLEPWTFARGRPCGAPTMAARAPPQARSRWSRRGSRRGPAAAPARTLRRRPARRWRRWSRWRCSPLAARVTRRGGARRRATRLAARSARAGGRGARGRRSPSRGAGTIRARRSSPVTTRRGGARRRAAPRRRARRRPSPMAAAPRRRPRCARPRWSAAGRGAAARSRSPGRSATPP